uniref:Uncharacterized protein n=1 Tax=Erpetoichthys calabaricus TaxID=27687 RepID=A0A8C4XBX6_ERPCA
MNTHQFCEFMKAAKEKQQASCQALLDVVQFRPEDITLQVYEIETSGKGHCRSRMEEQGIISRGFQLQQKVPDGLQTTNLCALLCNDRLYILELALKY